MDSSNELNDFEDMFIAECAAEAVDKQCNKLADEQGGDGFGQPEHGEQVVCEAEMAKAQMFTTPGKAKVGDIMGHMQSKRLAKYPDNEEIFPNHHHSIMDEEYLVVGGHVDQALQEKIAWLEYIDFAQLLPPDKISKVDDHRMELVVKGGSTFFLPVADRETTTISNFNW